MRRWLVRLRGITTKAALRAENELLRAQVEMLRLHKGGLSHTPRPGERVALRQGDTLNIRFDVGGQTLVPATYLVTCGPCTLERTV